jgi:MFS superfamily sulfate permease-like transporter
LPCLRANSRLQSIHELGLGQSVINVKSGGRGRLSCFCAATFLLFLVVVLAIG